MLPVISFSNTEIDEKNYINKKIAACLNRELSDILDWDLYLYESMPACLAGFEKNMISSPRIDNLQGCWSVITGLCNAKNDGQNNSDQKCLNMAVCFDSEEIGSSTTTGADSPMLVSILERIFLAFNIKREHFIKNRADSFMLSLDGAHAAHPGFMEKCDPLIKPLINQGPALKSSANMSYTSDSITSSVFKELCLNAQIPFQRFVNRSDMKGGSTIGPISWRHLDIKSMDVGIPMFAMHSSRETAGIYDHHWAIKFVKQFFSAL
jgi:aspartyl aminopeptidase